MYIDVVPYDPLWPRQFEAIKEKLSAALASEDYISIEHVGSTSVPGLYAKPRIDIDIVVKSEDHVKPIAEAISAMTDDHYWFNGDMGIPQRYVMINRDSVPRRNLYICIEGSLSLRNHLAVRDILRRDANLREEYALVKQDLSKTDFKNMDAYTECKNEILAKILQKAGLSNSETDSIKISNTVQMPAETRQST